MMFPLAFATLGTFFGYLNGTYVVYSASLIRLALAVVLVCIIFFFFSKRDPILRASVIATFFFCISFMYGSVIGHTRVSNFELQTITIDNSYVVRDIQIKDSSKTILFDDLVVYTKTNLPLVPDDIVHIKGEATNEVIIHPKDHDTDFASFDLARYWQTRGMQFVSFYPEIATTSEMIERHSIAYYAYHLREWFLNNLEQGLPNREAGTVMAMLYGDDNTISRDTAEVYRKAGISHILVLSGYNLAIVAGAVALVFRNRSVKTRVFVSIISIALFLLVVKAGIPLYRAALMALYALLATLFMKPANSKFIIWFIAFLFIIVSPVTALYDVSFHLSLLATMGIIYFYSDLKEFLVRYHFFSRLKKNIVFDAFLVSTSASLMTLPYIVYTFGTVNVMSLFVNTLVSILIPLIMLFGFLTSFFGGVTVIGKIFGTITFVFAYSVTSLAESVASDVRILDPISFTTFLLSYLFIFLLYRLLAFTLLYPHNPSTK